MNPPANPTQHDVCPNCKRILDVKTTVHGAETKKVFYCIEHGKMVPMRSAVFNLDYVWDGERDGVL